MKKSWDWLAFISYKHDDIEWARWLQERLEQYRLPSYLAEDYPEIRQDLKPIFRDETDLGLGYLDDNIKDCLRRSEYLIVICSRSTPGSPYVRDEVAEFIRQGKAARIIPFIIDGTPKECFPAPLLSLKKVPLAANVNEISRDYAAVKVIAALLGGVDIDKLWQRHLIAEEKEKERLVAEKRRLQTIQSRFLAEKAEALLAEGDIYTSRMLLREALPSVINDPEDRPLVKETMDVLRVTVDMEQSGSLCLIHKFKSSICSFDISCDGRYAAVGLYTDICSYGIPAIKVVDIVTGEHFNIASSDDGFNHGVDVVKFSSDGKYLLGYGFDSELVIWDLATSDIRKFSVGDEDLSIVAACWKGDTHRIAVVAQKSSDDGYVIVDYDVENRAYNRLNFNHDAYVECLESSHDGKYLAYSTSDKYLVVLDVEAGKIVLRVANGNKVGSLAFNPQNRNELLASCLNDNCLFLVNVDTRVIDMITHEQSGNSVFAYNRDGSHFVFEKKGALILADTQTKTAELLKMPVNDKITSVVFSGDGVYMAAIYPDGVYCYHMRTRAVWRVITAKNVAKIAFCGDTYKLVVSTSESGCGKLQILDLDYLFNLSNADVEYVAISPDEQYIAYLTKANYLFLASVNGKEARLIESFEIGASFNTKPILFSGDGRYIATLLLDGTAYVYDVLSGTGYRSGKIKEGELKNGLRLLSLRESVLMLFVENDSKLVFAVDESVGVWDFRNSKLAVKTFDFKIDDLAYSGKSNTLFLVKGYENGICASYNLTSGELRVKTISNVRTDGNNIITADDRGFNIYNVETGKSIDAEVFYYFRSLAVSPDNKYMALESPTMPHITIMNLETKEDFVLDQYSDSDVTDRVSMYFEEKDHVLVSSCDTNVSRWLLDTGQRQIFKKTTQVSGRGAGGVVAELKNGTIQIKSNLSDQELITEMNDRFSTRSFTEEEKKRYFLDE